VEAFGPGKFGVEKLDGFSGEELLAHAAG